METEDRISEDVHLDRDFINLTAGFISMAGFWMPFVPAADVQHVHFGSTVTLGCNISYLYETTWFKQNPDLIPTMVLCASLKEGQPAQGCQLSARFSVTLMNRSLALRITDVEERDLGLYYCIANVRTRLTIGRGTVLQVSSSGSSWLLRHHSYCFIVGLGLLLMTLTVCIAHCKAKSNNETNNNTPNRQNHLPQHSNFANRR